MLQNSVIHISRFRFSNILILICFLNEVFTSRLSLDGNGEYSDLVIAIDENVPESAQLLKNIKVSKGKVSLNKPPELIGHIDQESGEDTVFIFKLPASSPSQIVVISPSGVRYDISSGSQIYSQSNDGQTNTIIVTIPGIAESGEWIAQMVTPQSNMRVKRSLSSTEFGSFLLMTKPKKTSKASLNYIGRVDCDVITQADTNTRCLCIIVITNHGNEINNAEVIMVVMLPRGGEIRRNMQDKGIGSDFTPEDGVYSASIVGEDLTQTGIFNIKAEIKFKLNPEDKNFITRIETLGAVKVNSPFSSAIPDTTPPDRIRRVVVDVVDRKKKLVQLIFIAVGDDGDRGKADSYEFKLNDEILKGEDFQFKPKDSGSQEKFILSLDKITKNMNTNIYSLFIRAVDDMKNKGIWSMGYSLSFEEVKFDKTSVTVPYIPPKSYTIKSSMECRDIPSPTWNYRCVVNVNVTDDGKPVLDARVIMQIINEMDETTAVTMRDNGCGSDDKSGDGIYSASIIGRDFTLKGYYRIIADVQFNKTEETIREKIPIGSQNCRQNNLMSQNDDFPPDLIQSVSARVINDTEIIVTFIAVGDDGDRMKVKFYEVQVNDFPNKINSTAQSDPGTLESIRINVKEDHPDISRASSYSLSVRAVDHAKNRGNWSQPFLLYKKTRYPRSSNKGIPNSQ